MQINVKWNENIDSSTFCWEHLSQKKHTLHTAEVYYIEGYAIKILNFPKWSWNEVFIIEIRSN